MSRLLTRDRASRVMRALSAVSGEPSVALELVFGPRERLTFVRIRPGCDHQRGIRISHFVPSEVVPRTEVYATPDDFTKAYDLI